MVSVLPATESCAGFRDKSADKSRKAAERFSRYTGEKVIGKAKQLCEIAGAASTVHGWESAKGSGVNVLAQNAVVITPEQVADIRARLARLRGETPAE
jgi:hypothetical protein